jgi:hypothetical protein
MARTFALPKNGRQSKLRKAMDCHPERSEGSQKIFESWEATARLASGETIGKSKRKQFDLTR